jgi:hypothetical protein
MTADSLKDRAVASCPLCGRGARMTSDCGSGSYGAGWSYGVACEMTGCGCAVNGFPTPEAALKRWNTRTDDSSQAWRPPHFLIETDPAIPKDEIRARSGGKEVGRIVNIGEPHLINPEEIASCTVLQMDAGQEPEDLVDRVEGAIRAAKPERCPTAWTMKGDVVTEEKIEYIVTDRTRAKAAIAAMPLRSAGLSDAKGREEAERPAREIGVEVPGAAPTDTLIQETAFTAAINAIGAADSVKHWTLDEGNLRYFLAGYLKSLSCEISVKKEKPKSALGFPIPQNMEELLSRPKNNQEAELIDFAEELADIVKAGRPYIGALVAKLRPYLKREVVNRTPLSELDLERRFSHVIPEQIELVEAIKAEYLEDDMLIPNLVMFIGRLCYRLKVWPKETEGNVKIIAKTMDYLKRKGLEKNALRYEESRNKPEIEDGETK